ncbi:MAG: trifunctional glycosyltransferase/class I SAM-dependent methyltransferase/polysaccharide deacetylase [Gemmatimonadota bacterium]
MSFSIIIPAFNAGATLGETLDSLREQTLPDWEAIVVNDGSTDSTSEVAAAYAARDRRIRVMTQPNTGMTTARNAALPFAANEWIIFLDADDAIPPRALQHFAEAASADPYARAICGRWARVSPESGIVLNSFDPNSADLFSLVARFCPFAIHSCAVHREIIARLGGFDPAHRLCADWDFWQRMARIGTRVAFADSTVAYYRMRPGSSINNIDEILAEGLEIIDRGHGPDARIERADPRHAAGLPGEGLARARLGFTCWQAGLQIGRRRSATSLLRHLTEADHDPELPPAQVAGAIHAAALLPALLTPDRWMEQWEAVVPLIDGFLQALEDRAGAPALARRSKQVLERLILGDTPTRPVTVGGRHAISLEITEPMPDLAIPGGIERLICTLTLEGDEIGEIELPVTGPTISSLLLSDAIVAHHAWRILGRFMARHIYPGLTQIPIECGVRIKRGRVTLADRIVEPVDPAGAKFHDAVGWTVFLQEVWGLPDWPGDRFYQETTKPEGRSSPVGPAVTLEVSSPIPDLKTTKPVEVEWTMAGVPVYLGVVQPVDGEISAARLRAPFTQQMGLELATVAVREALVGRSMDDPRSLRDRLAQSARRKAVLKDQAFEEPEVAASTRNRLGPSWRSAVRLARAERPSAIFGQHIVGPPGTSVSRRALLPLAARAELLESAVAAREPVLDIRLALRSSLVYAPDLLWRREQVTTGAPPSTPPPAQRLAGEGYDRHYFETVFLAGSDPWQYATPFEQRKYKQTLSLIPKVKPQRALELACAEGIFTRTLAPLVHQLLATDISAVALERARTRCRGLSNVAFQLLDFASDPIPGQFDLVICSETLYYMRDRTALSELATRIAKSLLPGGHCITAHSTTVVDDPTSTGLDWDVPFGTKVIGEVFAATPGLRLVTELQTPYYRIQLLARADESDHGAGPAIDIREVPAAPLPEHLLVRYLEGGGPVRKIGDLAALTYRLPILLYHQVSEEGPDSLARYRVTPKAFEAQMQYLHQAGFRTVLLDEWLDAMRRRQPLTGRAVIITFDDGYRDFATYAWPVLRRHDFGAYVFLVTDRIGQRSEWTASYGETARLLDGAEIVRLHGEGVQFGSHTATHPHLEALTPTGVVREAARSRAALHRLLGVAITSIAYPHGSEDSAIQHLVGACGYIYGLSCREGLSQFTDPPLALPRVEVKGDDTLAVFIRKLGS